MSRLLRATAERVCEAAHGECACKEHDRRLCETMEDVAAEILCAIGPLNELELLYEGEATIRRKPARKKGPA